MTARRRQGVNTDAKKQNSVAGDATLWGKHDRQAPDQNGMSSSKSPNPPPPAGFFGAGGALGAGAPPP